MTRVKICGCRRVDDALAAQEAGADFIGLVFAPGSRRRVTIEQARQIIQALGGPLDAQLELPGAAGDATEWYRRGAVVLELALDRKRPLAVGVFEDQPIDEVNAIAEDIGLDLVQLSGRPSREGWDDCLRATRPVIKTIELPVVAGHIPAGAAIALLLDVSRGRGIAVDRRAATEVAAALAVWLAGGLTPENVSEAIREVRPWAVDVSSGVETDGRKDRAKISAFVQAAKMAVSTASERSP
jgi:phosphoribosylanthranilate isomerase